MSNVPKLRFKEFSEEFEYDILDELFTITSKKFDPTKHTDVKKCVELEHLSQETGNLLGYTNSNEQASIKNSFEKGQVLFGKLRPYLKKFWQANFDGVCSSEIWVLNGKKLTNNYLYHLVQTHKFNQISNVSSGSKMPRADWQYMSQIPFSYPSKQEQEKIASFLISVDTKIEQLTKKEALLSSYKKGAMQKIFSDEIRFKADDASEFCAWEEKKLGDIGKIYQPKTISQTDLTEEGYDVYGANGIIGKYIEFNHEYEQIAVTCRGNTCGTVNFTKPKSWITGNAMVVNLDTSINAIKSFLYYQLSFADLSYLITGSGQPQITGDIKNHKVYLPSIEEQTKIANFLSSIDSKIKQVKNQLNSTKEFKKALLQQMFV